MKATTLLFAASAIGWIAACAAPTASDQTLRRGDGNGASPDGTNDDGTSGSPGQDGGPGDNTTNGGDASTSNDGSPKPPPPPPGVGTLKPGTTTLSWNVAGQARTIQLVVPTKITSQAVPLVIALHGNGDTAANFVATRGLAQLAEQEGFVVAAPQGIVQNISVMGQTIPGVSWDAYRDLAGGNIDLALLDEIQNQLVKPGGQIDTKRVVVFGYSQGGYLGFRYGIDDSTKLACAAVVAASSPLGSGYIANATRKIPFALTIGTNDYGIAQARDAKSALTSAGFPLQYKEIAGAGHSPFPGTTAEPLDYCLNQSLP